VRWRAFEKSAKFRCRWAATEEQRPESHRPIFAARKGLLASGEKATAETSP